MIKGRQPTDITATLMEMRKGHSIHVPAAEATRTDVRRAIKEIHETTNRRYVTHYQRGALGTTLVKRTR